MSPLVAIGDMCAQETTAASSREVSPTPGIGRTANAFANPIASAPSSSKNDPFSTAAESSFDAPWCASPPPCLNKTSPITWYEVLVQQVLV